MIAKRQGAEYFHRKQRRPAPAGDSGEKTPSLCIQMSSTTVKTPSTERLVLRRDLDVTFASSSWKKRNDNPCQLWPCRWWMSTYVINIRVGFQWFWPITPCFSKSFEQKHTANHVSRLEVGPTLNNPASDWRIKESHMALPVFRMGRHMLHYLDTKVPCICRWLKSPWGLFLSLFLSLCWWIVKQIFNQP